jgi:hypothetical protein
LGPTIVGSGVTTVETRELGAFHGVDVSSAFEATVAIGTTQSVTLSVDDNLLALVETEVKDGQLSIGYRAGSNVSSAKPQKVAIVVPALDSIVASGAAKVSATVGETKAIKIEAEGAARVDVRGLASDSVDVDANGAGQVSLSGKGKRLKLEADGASTFRAPDVVFESATIDISGASRGEVQVTGPIDGEVSGASTLSLRGKPASRTVKTSGASRITD